MNDLATEQKDPDKLHELKRLTATVYLCQALSFIFAAVPLLVGVAINFFKRDEVQGTWLESHFNFSNKNQLGSDCWGCNIRAYFYTGNRYIYLVYNYILVGL